MMKLTAVMAAMVLAGANGFAQRAPNVSQVLTYSTLTDKQIAGSPSLFSVYTFNPATPLTALGDAINQAGNYRVAHSSALSGAISANVAVALSVIPFASPTSGVILKKDPATGALLPSSSSLGPIFTQRAETVGKGSWYIGFTQQNFHFSEINGQKLNGLSLLYSGGDASGIPEGGAGTVTTKTAPATYNVAMDVRLSQNLAVITYGLTNRLDVSVGLAMVHARVDSTAYNAVAYTGNGLGFANGAKCWCVNTFQPGVQTMNLPQIGRASYGKSGFGDMVVRVKGNVFEGPRASLAVGTDLRLPTGDSANYLGIGTTAVKPFAAMSLYSKPMANGIVFAPHFEIGWQISGKSNLGGTLSGTAAPRPVQPGVTVPVFAAPLTVQKGYVPDILSWSVGTEVAIGAGIRWCWMCPATRSAWRMGRNCWICGRSQLRRLRL